MNRMIVLTLLALIVIPAVTAFGVTPGRQTYDYRPEINGKFTIVNNYASDVELAIVARGPLADHVEFSDRTIRMSPDDATHTIEYALDLPSDLEPGEHTIDAYVLALETSEGGANVVGATTGVVSQIKIKVPYPGRYVRARLDYDAATKTVIVPVFGLGSQRIDDLTADVTVFGPTNEVVTSARSDVKQLEAGASEEFRFPLDLAPGTYLVRATVSYGDSTKVVERTINVGSARVVIQDVSVPEYQFGAISKLVLHVKSEWNQPIDTTAIVEFLGPDGALVERIRSAQTLIEPFAREDINVYWDSAGYEYGEYRITAKLSAGNDTIERSFPATLSPTSIEIGTTGRVTGGDGGSPIALIIVAVVVLIILNAVLLFVLFKRK